MHKLKLHYLYLPFFLLTLLIVQYSPAKSIEPPFRGIVEGFYGPPWSHENRISMIRFMGQVGLNYYVYAPKDDSFHRSKWREAYPPEQVNQLKSLALECKKNNVNFCFAISPGLDITYSSESDFNILLHKLESIHQMGVTHFALFLDDVQLQFTHSEDSTAFNSFGDAHVELANKLYKQLKQIDTHNHLIFCPTQYYLITSTPYLDTVGSKLNKDIPLIWTGEDVTTPKIPTENLMKIREIYHRKPFLWDNYPVNDYARDHLFLGPILNRTPAIGSHLSGYIANPMNESELSKIPLYTISKFLQEPYSYNPEKEWENAILFVGGKEAQPYLKMFCEESRSSFLTPDESIQTGLEIADYLEGPNTESTLKLESRLKQFVDLSDNLQKTTSNQELLKEMKPYLEKLALYGKAGLGAMKIYPLALVLPFHPRWLQYKAQVKELRANHFSIGDKALMRLINAGLSRGVQDRVGPPPKITSTMAPFQLYTPEQAVDDDTVTFYWTSKIPSKDDSIIVDYGKLTTADQVVLLCGSEAHAGDFIHQGICEFSEDGNNWVSPTIINKAEDTIPITKPFRFLRLRTTIEEKNWVVVREIMLQ